MKPGEAELAIGLIAGHISGAVMGNGFVHAAVGAVLATVVALGVVRIAERRISVVPER